MNSEFTIVTGLFDLGRGELEGFGRSFDHYLECFNKLLKVNYPMVIFIPEELNDFVKERRVGKATHIINKSLDSLKSFPFYNEVQSIRKTPKWINRAGWIENSPQAKLELYNPLVMSKQFFVNDACLFNPFNSTYFMWVDGGIANTIGDPSGYFDEGFGSKICEIFRDNKMHYLCFPYEPEAEVHGFEKNAFYEFAKEPTKYVARGGIFGGSKDAINQINNIYYALLKDTLSSGFMGTEESIFTIITYLHPTLCTRHMIQADGLVFRFLEKIKNMKPIEYESELNVYVLTFNLPEQFKMWLDHFEKNLEPRMRNKVNLIVLNNSTDESAKEVYNSMLSDIDCEIHEFDNIGICRARQFAADHFHESKSKYMVFFEDDMLLCGPEDNDKRCKNGFNKYFTNLFTNSISILERERLDYLKLCFSEFYGDNHENWAWYNVPEERRLKWFSAREYKDDPKKTEIFYTGAFKQIPYAIGEYHYCNWPVLFSRDGNQKIFQETRFDHPYEQTWMSFVMGLMRDNKIRAGCLLGSPITHDRKYHYSKHDRREN